MSQINAIMVESKKLSVKEMEGRKAAVRRRDRSPKNEGEKRNETNKGHERCIYRQSE